MRAASAHIIQGTGISLLPHAHNPAQLNLRFLWRYGVHGRRAIHEVRHRDSPWSFICGRWRTHLQGLAPDGRSCRLPADVRVLLLSHSGASLEWLCLGRRVFWRLLHGLAISPSAASRIQILLGALLL
jgi:hypothetical protein